MFINLYVVMKDKGLSDASLSAELGMREEDFIDKKCGVMQFTTCERLAISLLTGFPVSWLFERM